MTDVLIVRHGQSEWNARGLWQGQADPPLSTLGEQQAIHAARRLEDIGRIIASDLQRARVTAELIAEQLNLSDVVVEPRFRERHAGEWQGLTKGDIEERWPGYLAERRRPPGFESDQSLTERTDEGLRRALDEHPAERVLIVSHGGVIYRREQMLGAAHERIPNLGGRWFVATAGHGPDALTLGERVTLVADDELTVPNQL